MAQVTKKEVDVVVCGLGWAGSLMSIELALAGLDACPAEAADHDVDFFFSNLCHDNPVSNT